MQLNTIYARFFRSLNYDYLRQSSGGYSPDPWDETPGGQSYPFVRVSLEPDVTTVVGANESGKSQLLDALKLALDPDSEIKPRDFCRYSPFFSREEDLTLPEVGVRFTGLGPEHCELIAEMCGLDAAPQTNECALFRMNTTPMLRLYFRSGEGWEHAHVRKPTLLHALGVPRWFEIDSKIPLPDSVPLDYLATGSLERATGRDAHRAIWDKFRAKADTWFGSQKTVEAHAAEIYDALGRLRQIDQRTQKMYQLAADLLLKVAGLPRALFAELRDAIAAGDNGYARGIVDTINDEISKSLNFPHWWSQDSNFELLVEEREYDLVFMIRDRTGTSYSFAERSFGMKYFLSYFVQFKSHEPPADGQRELLLMDEPDAYLSSSGQQDLLRIFEAFAHPEEPGREPVQVVYVTHSPFLIDKNHAERIKVLEKGEHDEGTRVVRNASRNHYEPLRSALGGFVGETTFIGSCNLLLEGVSDQILIAGVSSWLRRRGAPQVERLDLNAITLVPAGGAPNIPYLAYLARGRDVDRPAVICLLDSDPPGDDARKALARGGARGKQVLDERFIVQVAEVDGLVCENPAGCAEIEDLVPFALAERALERYCQEFVPEIIVSGLRLTAVGVYRDGKSTLKALEAAVRQAANESDFHLDKIGFARSLVAALEHEQGPGADTVAANFKLLLAQLARMQRAANREVGQEKIRSRINRARKRFEADHPAGARREHVLLLREEIENQLDNSLEAEEVRAAMREWITRFNLEEDPRSELEDYDAFREALKSAAYAGLNAASSDEQSTASASASVGS